MLKETWERFCQLYVENGGNASQAYLDAGVGETEGGSLASCASRLLKKADIQIRISQIRSKHHSKYEVNQDVIIDRLCKIIFEGNTIAEIDENGELRLIPYAELDDVDSVNFNKSESSSSSYSASGGGDSSSTAKSVSIKNRDKIKALDMLCKILGIYNDNKKSGDSGTFDANSRRALDAIRKLRTKNVSSEDSRE